MRWMLVLGVLALALNLRAALAGYPPLLPAVRAELGLSAAVAGLVQAGAVLAMAAGSFAGVPIAARFGAARSLGAAVGLVAVGSLARGAPSTVSLVGGTVLVGLGMGTAGVFLAGVVRTYFAARAGTVTGGYVVAMLAGATASSAIAVPLATLLGGWSFSLAVWAVPALLAVAGWTPVARAVRTTAPGRPAPRADRRASTPPPRVSPRRWTRLARLASVYQAGTSLVYYGWLTWMAPYYQSQGWAPALAGVLMAVFSLAQVPSALLAPALVDRRRRWRFWASLAVGTFAVGTLGALLVPLPPVVGPWPWVILIGLGGGAMFPLGMTIIAWRTPDGPASASTSGLALGVGYTVAGLAPLLMGLLVDATGGYRAAICVLLTAAALQAWAIIRLGDG